MVKEVHNNGAGLEMLERELERAANDSGMPVEELIRILLSKLSIDLEVLERSLDV